MSKEWDDAVKIITDHKKMADDAIAACKSMIACACPPGTTLLILDKYERDNLLALLHLIYQVPGGPNGLSTGDWSGQLYWKLADRGFDPELHSPNVSPTDQLARLKQWYKP